MSDWIVGRDYVRSLLKDGERKAALTTTWSQAAGIQDFQVGNTEQGTRHCERVENNVGRLLKHYGIRLSPACAFILSAASALHDIGKAVTLGPDDDHGVVAAKLIRLHCTDIFDDGNVDLCDPTADIVSVHASGELETIDEYGSVGADEIIPLRCLAALFRLADMIETTSARAPHLASLLRVREVELHEPVWRGRESLHAWNARDDEILITLTRNPKPHVEDALKAIDMMNSSMTASHKQYLRTFVTPKDGHHIIRELPQQMRLVTEGTDRQLLEPHWEFPFVRRRVVVDGGIHYFEDTYHVRNTGSVPIHSVPHVLEVERYPEDPSRSIRLYREHPIGAGTIELTCRGRTSNVQIQTSSSFRGRMEFRVILPPLGEDQQIEYTVTYRIPSEACARGVLFQADAHVEKLELWADLPSSRGLHPHAHRSTPVGTFDIKPTRRRGVSSGRAVLFLSPRPVQQDSRYSLYWT